ncbi:MAG: hypothetical protein GXP26_09350 [Planctomycetes bacterium]|nr:hypothetical protein [Planctomycetota bacterium]
MFLRLFAITLLMPLVAVLGGCACPSSCRVPYTPSAPCPSEPTVAEGEAPDLAALQCEDCELLPLPVPTETFQLLDESTCQCNAATNANLANMIELERHWAKVVIECDSKNVRKNLCLDRDLLALHAYGIRNTAAASALETFYQLAGLEAHKFYLGQGIEETEQTLERVNQFRLKGISLPDGIDRSALVARLSELTDQQLQLDFLRIQLNGQLQKLVGCPLDENAFYWPNIEWTPNLKPLDVEVELADGLASRSDLRGLSLVIGNLEKPTLPIARGVLKLADSTIGSVEPIDGLMHTIRCFRCNQHEVPVRCRQLAMFYSETEKLATADIKSAVYKVTLQQQRVALAQDTVLELRKSLRELTETRDANDVTVFEISKLRGLVYEAESKLVEQIVALKVASVGLRKAQGTLPMECGMTLALCCEGPSTGDCMQTATNTCQKENAKCCK